MARGAAQAQRKRAKPEQKRSKRVTPAYEQTMFFPRLRRQAKWVFVFLALVFAVGFVAFGVGSGSTGIGDILRGNFFGGGSNSTSSRIKDDQNKIAQNPQNIQAYLDLSGIYQQQQNNAQAISVLKRAQKVAPKNLDVLNQLAGIYRGQAEQARVAAQNAQIAFFDGTVTPPGLDTSSTLGQALSSDPYSSSLRTKANDAYSAMVSAYSKAVSAYKQVAAAAKGTSQEANAQLQLGSAAELAGDSPTAIQAYTRFLRLAPDSPNASAVQQSLARLRASSAQTQG
jgi:tetratricopeptide (TPR) repeat protein